MGATDRVSMQAKRHERSASFLRASQLRPLLQTLVVLILATMSALLWCAAVFQLRDTFTEFGATDSRPAVVVSCPTQGLLPGQCQVMYRSDGQQIVRRLTHTGLLGVDVGDEIMVHTSADGAAEDTVAIGGWRLYLDSFVLVVLAMAVTSYTLRRWVSGTPPTRRRRS